MEREVMEWRPMVSYLTRSMNTLLDKLTKLKNRPKIVEELQEDLVTLKEGFFDKLAGRWEMDEQVKERMKQVRELVFDIEDWIDQMPETKNLGESESEEKIKEFKTLIQEARDLGTRYILLDEADVAGVAASKVTIDSRLLWGEKTCLVALDRPKEKLKKHLMDDQMKLKVVSIVGTGGLGKTTLAKEVHGELLREFKCRAFVYIGRNPSIKTILINILHQVMSPRERKDVFTNQRKRKDVILKERLDEQQVIALLWELLGKKRYLIVLDGIWSIQAWRVISCALPDNYLASRVLTTTRIKDVAESCSPRCTDVVYQMEALSEDDSKSLFSCRMSVGEGKRPVDLKEVPNDNNILKMCGGIPLAIIVAASLLPRKSEELAEPKMFGKSILSSLKQYSMPEGMTKVLQMSYADLSLPVQSCILYLSVFPEDYTIKKNRLIRLWGAEGFIPRIDKESLWVTGESYFNELISRRMIQPVFDYSDDQAVGCTVHGVILDFIRSLSREENFATTAAELSSGRFPCDTIRRFSLDCSNKDEAGILAASTVHLSSMRSLTGFGDVEGMLDPPSPSDSDDDPVPPALKISMNILSAFKLMRVLDLEDTTNLEDHHLIGIGGLVLLRYLGLGGTGITRLPEEVGELKQLETLDMGRNGLCTLPASIIGLRKLVHLLLDIDNIVINRILEMQELEEVSNVRAYDSRSLSSVAELLRKSKRLRMLGVTLGGSYPRESLMSFLEEVVHSDLHSLSLHFRYDDDEWFPLLVNSWKKVNAPPVTLKEFRRFELTISAIFLSGVLRNMDSLVSLTHLHIQNSILEAGGLHVLGGLPKLVLLNLSSQYAPRESCFVKKGVFPCLKVLSFACHSGGMRLLFEEGAMPQLRRLGLSFKPSESSDPYAKLNSGIEHLTSLTRVHATINCKYATVSKVEAAEAHIRAQVSRNPNKPTLELSRTCEDQMDIDLQTLLSLIRASKDKMEKNKGQHSQK